MVLGIGLAGGEPVSAGLLAAIFVSNLPEAIGGATEHAQADAQRSQGSAQLALDRRVLRARVGRSGTASPT